MHRHPAPNFAWRCHLQESDEKFSAPSTPATSDHSRGTGAVTSGTGMPRTLSNNQLHRLMAGASVARSSGPAALTAAKSAASAANAVEPSGHSLDVLVDTQQLQILRQQQQLARRNGVASANSDRHVDAAEHGDRIPSSAGSIDADGRRTSDIGPSNSSGASLPAGVSTAAHVRVVPADNVSMDFTASAGRPPAAPNSDDNAEADAAQIQEDTAATLAAARRLQADHSRIQRELQTGLRSAQVLAPFLVIMIILFVVEHFEGAYCLALCLAKLSASIRAPSLCSRGMMCAGLATFFAFGLMLNRLEAMVNREKMPNVCPVCTCMLFACSCLLKRRWFACIQTPRNPIRLCGLGFVSAWHVPLMLYLLRDFELWNRLYFVVPVHRHPLIVTLWLICMTGTVPSLAVLP